jgi:hypothetical protein
MTLLTNKNSSNDSSSTGSLDMDSGRKFLFGIKCKTRAIDDKEYDEGNLGDIDCSKYVSF